VEAKYRFLVEQIPVITYTAALDVPGWLLYVSPQLMALGYAPQAWIAETDALLKHIHPDDRRRAKRAFERVRSAGKPVSCEYRLLAGNGDVLWFRDEACVVRDEAGNPLFVQAILIDVSESKRVEDELRAHRCRLEELVVQRTAALNQANELLQQDILERRRAEEALFQEKERAQFTLASIGDAVITTDACGRIAYMNPVAIQFTGWSAAEAQGQPLAQVFNIINEISREPAENPVTRCLREGHAIDLANHSILLRQDGSELAIADAASPIHDRQGNTTGTVMVFRDVTQERKRAQQLFHQATHDVLTGLANRREFEQRVERVLANARADGADHALCFLDLDRFKVLNDSCGHAAGDELLRQLSAMLLERMRSRDTLARLGGDEFGLLLEHCPLEQAWGIADELLQAVQQFKFVWEGKIHSVGVSIGVAPITSESESLSEVLRAADAACYTAKGKGRNRVHVYQADAARAPSGSEMPWVARITRALEEDRFGLFYQTIAELAPYAKERAHYEILVRMLEPDGQVIAPEVFLPAAERYNLMPAIDRWVVRRVISWLAALPADSEQRAAIYSINLSSASLADPAMLDYIRELLILNQVPGRMLGFEIAETTAIANLAQVTHFFREIKKLGCRTTLDNFGSAMSFIASLNVLQMDYLKIDGNFVKHIAEDRIAQSLLEAINQVAHEMSARTVAGWTESAAILDILEAIGVDCAQGYAISRPRPLAELGMELAVCVKSSPGMRSAGA
jgi:diguanylate cyclase (GGDEF)-like protein/PAS domain S-box-containing protein